MKRRFVPGASYEEIEQGIVCDWMRLHRIKFFSVPNEAALKSSRNRYKMIEKLKHAGLLPGAPDLVLITRPPVDLTKHVVIEMKRGGKRPGVVSPHQKIVHADMDGEGWIVIVGIGADAAVARLRALGWGN